jgi:GTP-dependent phosphoenolpyruvate carboxykinase
MFRMLGKKVELYRYKVTYTENEEVLIENCISEEHKNEIEQVLTDKEITFETTLIDQTGSEWFNGLEFDSYDEALAVFSKGKQAYLQEKQRQELTDSLRLRADIDYLAIMSGVEI